MLPIRSRMVKERAAAVAACMVAAAAVLIFAAPTDAHGQQVEVKSPHPQLRRRTELKPSGNSRRKLPRQMRSCEGEPGRVRPLSE